IRDWSVTGVQTCALPIYAGRVLRTGKCPAIHDVTDQFLLARVTQFWIRVTRAGQELYFREIRAAAGAEVRSQHLPEMRIVGARSQTVVVVGIQDQSHSHFMEII